MPKCNARSFSQQRCRRETMPDSDRCILHDPRENKPVEAFREAMSNPYQIHTGIYDFSRMTIPRGIKIALPADINALHCRETVFCEPVSLQGVTVRDLAYFRGSRFLSGVDFSGARFRGRFNFQETTVFGSAKFTGAHFLGDLAYFLGAHFPDGDGMTVTTDFSNTRFNADAVFKHAQCAGPLDFTRVEFDRHVNFFAAEIEELSFSYATFRGHTRLDSMDCGSLSLYSSVFEDLVELSSGRRSYALEGYPTRMSFYCVVAGPRMRISHSDLSACSFVGTDLSDVTFLDVKWPMFGARRVVADEMELRGSDYDYPRPEDVADVYRSLRRNFESRLAYHEASDFYVGEMEMRLLSARAHKRWREYVPLVTYRTVSGYGEDWIRPLQFLGVWSALFAASVLLGGVVIGTQGSGYRVIDYALEGQPALGSFFFDYIWALSYALSVSLLRSPPDVALMSNWVRILQVVSVVVGPTAIALMLLALRRAFRRGPTN